MKPVLFALSLVFLAVPLAGCSGEQAPGYDSASKEAAEALARNNNDISKLTPEQRAALEKAAKQTRPEGGMEAPGSGSAPSSGSGTSSPTGG